MLWARKNSHFLLILQLIMAKDAISCFFNANDRENVTKVFLNKENGRKLLKLCNELSMTNDQVFQHLLMTFDSQTSTNSAALDEHDKSASHKDRIYLELCQQRKNNSSKCDLHYFESPENGSKYFSAHTWLLRSFFGEQFMVVLTDLYYENHGKTFNVNEKNEKLNVAPGFDNIVQYCYTGDFNLLDNSSVKVQQVQTWIEQVVEEGVFKTSMVSNLEKINKDTCSLGEQAPFHATEELQFLELPDNDDADKVDLNQDENCEDLETDGNNTGLDITNYQVVDANDPAYEPNVSDPTSDLFLLDTETEYLADNKEINVEISTSQSDEFVVGQSLSSISCDVCERKFSTKEQLCKHLQDEHFKKLPTRKSARSAQKRKIFSSIECDYKPKSKKASNKIEMPIGECCDQEFFSKLKLGIHIFREHSTVCANCSECQQLVLLNELVSHYQTLHNYGPFPKVENTDTTKTSIQATFSHTVHPGNDNLRSIDFNLQQIPTTSTVAGSNDPLGCFDGMNLPLGSNPAISNVEDLWSKEVTCVGCNVRMTVSKYVDHLNEQFDSARNTLAKGINLHKFHRCVLYQCQLCQNSKLAPEKAMRLYLMLSKHITRYHEIGSTGDEKVPCDVCGTLVVKFYLKSHKRTHLPGYKKSSLFTQKVTCDICGKEIIKKRITVHRRTHFEKYSCPHCAKVFNRKENLRVHERIHTGEKPYVCDVCGKGFRQHVELRLHNRKHEKEKAQNMPTQSQNQQYINQALFYVQGNLVG